MLPWGNVELGFRSLYGARQGPQLGLERNGRVPACRFSPKFPDETKKGPQILSAGLPSDWRCSGTLCSNPPVGIIGRQPGTVCQSVDPVNPPFFRAVFTRLADGNYSFMR